MNSDSSVATGMIFTPYTTGPTNTNQYVWKNDLNGWTTDISRSNIIQPSPSYESHAMNTINYYKQRIYEIVAAGFTENDINILYNSDSIEVTFKKQNDKTSDIIGIDDIKTDYEYIERQISEDQSTITITDLKNFNLKTAKCELEYGILRIILDPLFSEDGISINSRSKKVNLKIQGKE